MFNFKYIILLFLLFFNNNNNNNIYTYIVIYTYLYIIQRVYRAEFSFCGEQTQKQKKVNEFGSLRPFLVGTVTGHVPLVDGHIP